MENAARRLRPTGDSAVDSAGDPAGGSSSMPVWRSLVDIGCVLRLARAYDGAALLLIAVAEILIVAQSGQIPGQFYFALVNGDKTLFAQALQNSLFWFTLSALLAALKDWTAQLLVLRWRGTLTRLCHVAYCSKRFLYSPPSSLLPPTPPSAELHSGIGPKPETQSGTGPAPDNPDQRIAAEIQSFCSSVSELLLKAVAAPLMVLFYLTFVWSLVGPWGLLSLAAFFTAGSVAVAVLMSPIPRIVAQQERLEAEFRMAHVRVKQLSEEILFSAAEGTELNELNSLFDLVQRNRERLIRRTFLLNLATKLFDYWGSFVNYCVLAIVLFGGISPLYPAGADKGAVAQLISNASFATLQLVYGFSQILDSGRTLSVASGYASRVLGLFRALGLLDPPRSSDLARPSQFTKGGGCLSPTGGGRRGQGGSTAHGTHPSARAQSLLHVPAWAGVGGGFSADAGLQHTDPALYGANGKSWKQAAENAWSPEFRLLVRTIVAALGMDVGPTARWKAQAQGGTDLFEDDLKKPLIAEASAEPSVRAQPCLPQSALSCCLLPPTTLPTSVTRLEPTLTDSSRTSRDARETDSQLDQGGYAPLISANREFPQRGPDVVSVNSFGNLNASQIDQLDHGGRVGGAADEEHCMEVSVHRVAPALHEIVSSLFPGKPPETLLVGPTFQCARTALFATGAGPGESEGARPLKDTMGKGEALKNEVFTGLNMEDPFQSTDHMLGNEVKGLGDAQWAQHPVLEGPRASRPSGGAASEAVEGGKRGRGGDEKGDEREETRRGGGEEGRGREEEEDALSSIIPAEVADEMDRLLRNFFGFQQRVCQHLRAQGHWADAIDPCTGFPLTGGPVLQPSNEATCSVSDNCCNCSASGGAAAPQGPTGEGWDGQGRTGACAQKMLEPERYSEAFAAQVLLGYTTHDAGPCRVVIHPRFGARAYPASIFTDAPFLTFRAALQAAANPADAWRCEASEGGALGYEWAQLETERPAIGSEPSSSAWPPSQDHPMPGLSLAAGRPRLVLSNLCCTNPGTGQPIVKHLSLALLPGQGILITGPSGCGKTSLLRCLAGLWPITEGHVSEVGRGTNCMFLPQRPILAPGAATCVLCHVAYPTVLQCDCRKGRGADACWAESPVVRLPAEEFAHDEETGNCVASVPYMPLAHEDARASMQAGDRGARAEGGARSMAEDYAARAEYDARARAEDGDARERAEDADVRRARMSLGAVGCGDLLRAEHGWDLQYSLMPGEQQHRQLADRLSPGAQQQCQLADRLSPGEQQRLQLARAFFHRPQVLFLDEASSAIDAASRHQIFSALSELGMTMVTVSHHKDALAQWHDRELRLLGDGTGRWQVLPLKQS